MPVRFGGIGVRQKWERWVWQSPRRALTPRIEAAADRMGWMNRMEVCPEAAWEEDLKHRVGSTGAFREGAVRACVRLWSWFALLRALVP